MISRDYRIAAKERLQNNWGVAILAVFIFGAIVGLSSNFPIVGAIFLGYPLIYGYAKFNMAMANGYADMENLFDGFRENYMENALTILIYRLYAFLWTLLFIIPGIIKAYSYSMTPYILVDSDYKLFHNDAIKKSQELMSGYKWKLFKLQLSFIGWHFLGLLTLGILNILYVGPYQNQAVVQFYYDIKKNDVNTDRVHNIVDEIIPLIDDDENEWDF